MNFQWTILGEDFGTCDLSNDWRGCPPEADYYCCPRCGVIWATRIPVDQSAHVYHSFHHTPCPGCSVLGSLHPSREEIQVLPRPVLCREIAIAAEHPTLYFYMSRQETL